MTAQEERAVIGSGEESERRFRHLVRTLLTYYQRQKIAGKLNFVLLLLWSLVLANSVFVFAALYVAYGNAQSITTLNSFEK